QAALERFPLDRLVILVGERPGHKPPEAPPEARIRMTRAAFPDRDVELDSHAWTVDMLRARKWDDPIFLIGADQLVSFSSWKEPEAVLGLARLGVATRPGHRAHADDPRIELFEMPPVDVSSSEVRRRIAAGEPIDSLVPPAVAELIAELALYR